MSTATAHAPRTGLPERLSSLDAPIRMGIIGMGAMGKGLLYQATRTPGLRCVAVTDLAPGRAAGCAAWAGVPFREVESDAAREDAIGAGALAVCADGEQVARCEQCDVIIEASSAVEAAGRYSVAALETGKHLVMMNAEADLIFGPYLMQLARRHGLGYTSCDGDQHGVIQRLVEEIRLWGFELVMAGNIKGFLDRRANPTSIIPAADERRLDYKMCTAYTDGTKLCVEMALVANALGLRTCVPGMYGPPLRHVSEALRAFDLQALWQGQPFVDYILGAEPGGGVFVVGYSDNPYQRDMMAYYKMGPGPFYVFYRPYHLCHVEAMRCVAEIVLDGQPLLEPRHGFRTNVYAYAKKPLRAGEVLDGIGGYALYGQIENCSERHPGLPICLAEELVLRTDVAQDQPVLLSDVACPGERGDFALYARALSAAAQP